MTSARKLWILLLSAVVLVCPAVATKAQEFGGDSGVVILPGTGSHVTNAHGDGKIDATKVSVSMPGDAGSVLFLLPDSMRESQAVMLMKDGVAIQLRVIAQHIEIDAATVESLVEAGIEHFELLAVSSNLLAIRAMVTVRN